MGSQPNLASRSEMVSIYKCLTNISGLPEKFKAQKNIKFWTPFSATSALYTAGIQNETLREQTKNASVIL